MFNEATYWRGRHRAGQPSGALLQAEHSFLCEQIQARSKPGDRVLDFGCGDGILASKYLLPGMDWAGLDISPDAVRRSQRRGLVARELDIAQPLPLGMADLADLVLCLNVLYHMPTRLKADQLLANLVIASRSLIMLVAWEREPAQLAPHCFYWPLSPLEGAREVERLALPGPGGKVLQVLRVEP